MTCLKKDFTGHSTGLRNPNSGYALREAILATFCMAFYASVILYQSRISTVLFYYFFGHLHSFVYLKDGEEI